MTGTAVAGAADRDGLALALRAYPTLLRVGFASAVAYRAELIVWMLTMTMPLVSMALWTTAAEGQRLGPEGFGSSEFVAYFLLTLIVRLLTGNWVLWQVSEDIRTGTLGQRLLRPIHPLIFYTAEQIAALPLRALFVLPISAVLLFVKARAQITHDPGLIGLFLLALPAAWLLSYLAMSLIGMLAFFIDSAMGPFYAWTGLFTLLSGYILPLSLLPAWLQRLAAVLPFRYMLEVPVKILLGWPMPGGGDGGAALRDTAAGRAEALLAVGVAYLYVCVLLGGVMWLWRKGLRRFAAFGS